MKKYIVVCTDFGETCDGHARLLGQFESLEQAKEYVVKDMKDSSRMYGTADIFDEGKMEIWTNNYRNGCVWTILDLEKTNV